MDGRIDASANNTLDLGCGDRMRVLAGYNAFGVDHATHADNIFNCDLFKDRIPVPDKSFYFVFAYDFLEHVPTAIYYNGKLIHPRIHVMNEAWRVLKVGGIFESRTPYFEPGLNEVGWCQDPTHQIPWCKESFSYFSDKGEEWDRLRNLYSIEARFQIEDMHSEGMNLFVRLRKNE